MSGGSVTNSRNHEQWVKRRERDSKRAKLLESANKSDLGFQSFLAGSANVTIQGTMEAPGSYSERSSLSGSDVTLQLLQSKKCA